MKILLRLIKYFGPIFPGVLTAFLGAIFFTQYQQPQVVYYTDGFYSRIDNLLIGSIFVVNEGRSSASNLNILIEEKLLNSDITVDYLSVKPGITTVGDKTRITIPKLQPQEYAEITFRSRGAKRDFTIENVTSDSGGTTHRDWIKKSWLDFTLSKFQTAIILFVVTVFFLLGFSIRRIKSNLKQPFGKKGHVKYR